MDLLFSFVIPAYNRPIALKRLLDSLLSIDFPREKFEIIVIDNYKNFQAKEWLMTWYAAKETILCQHEPLPGSHQARNAGAKIAKGKYLVFLDDDCEATPNFLKAYVEVLDPSSVKMMGGRIEVKWDAPPNEEVRAFEHLMGKINLGAQRMSLPQGKYLNGGNMVIERELFLRLGGMEPDQVGSRLVGSGDVGLCRRVLALGEEILWVPDALVFHWQTAKINGRLRDLVRREINNGICWAYEDAQSREILSKQQRGRQILSKGNSFRKKLTRLLMSWLANQPKTLLFTNLLDAAKVYGYLYYFARYGWLERKHP